MQEKQTSNKKILFYIIPIAVVILVIIIVAAVTISRRSAANAELEPGLSYIESLESTSTEGIESEIRSIRAEQMKTAIEDGTMDIWQLFSDVAIVGDSRAAGFAEYEVLDSSRVVYKIGYSAAEFVRNFDQFSSQLSAANPSYIVLIFGLNDIEMGITVDDYIEDLVELSDKCREVVPGAAVYINSIVPTTQAAIESHPEYAEIPSWNATVETYCEEHDIPYIDITDTVNAHMDLYDTDGMHLYKEFMEYWAVDIITEITENE